MGSEFIAAATGLAMVGGTLFGGVTGHTAAEALISTMECPEIGKQAVLEIGTLLGSVGGLTGSVATISKSRRKHSGFESIA